MMLRDGYRCQYCKDSFPPSLLTCDHVVPRAYGGSSTWENTVCACTACNAKKASLLPSQLKAVGMRLPNPRAPSAYELEAAARGLAVHNLLRKKNVHVCVEINQ
jgi:5-methylcytosine-specific restriction endonuclease McrA